MESVGEGKVYQGALMFMSILLPFSVVAWFLATVLSLPICLISVSLHPSILCTDCYF